MSWENKNSVLIYRSSDFGFKPSIAGCGLHNTLLKRTEKNPKVWEIWKPEIIQKFKEIHENGGSIVFFSNQSHNNRHVVKARFNKFMEKFMVDDTPVPDAAVMKPIPVMAFFALKKNCFKKPFTNLWKVLGFIYQKDGHDMPNPETSIFIGGNDGGMYLMNRKECAVKSFTQKIFRNRSDVDRAFAANLGLHFIYKNAFFFGTAEPKWKWHSHVMTVNERMKYFHEHKEDKDPNLADLLTGEKNFILIMGRPSSGKTTLSKMLIDQLHVAHGEDYIINVLNDKKIGRGKVKFHKQIKDSIFEKSTILITKFSDYKSRNAYMKIARKFEAKILIINLLTETKMCQVLNYTKVQTSRDFDLEIYPYGLFDHWDKSYEPPEYVEDDITTIEHPLILRFRKELKYQYSPF
jgi:hypothetical protein